jgi:hypothetical protein
MATGIGSAGMIGATGLAIGAAGAICCFFGEGSQERFVFSELFEFVGVFFLGVSFVSFQVISFPGPELKFLQRSSVKKVVVVFPFHHAHVDFTFAPVLQVLFKSLLASGIQLQKVFHIILSSIIIMIKLALSITSLQQIVVKFGLVLHQVVNSENVFNRIVILAFS